LFRGRVFKKRKEESKFKSHSSLKTVSGQKGLLKVVKPVTEEGL